MLSSSLLKKTVMAGFLIGTTATAQPAGRAPLGPEPPEPAGAIYHFARAHDIAGRDPYLSKWVDQGVLCRSPRVSGQMIAAARQPAVETPMKPTQLFDNFYIVGNSDINAFILKTSAGLVMWDTMDNADEAQNIVEAGIRQLGLDPADIKYIIVTHGHGDHYGGAKYFQDKYHMPVGLTQEDWDYMAKSPFPIAIFGPPPAKDQILTDGEDLTIGDATIHIVKTPGHTPGVASSVFPVKDKGVTRTMAMWGGTAYGDAEAQHNSLHKLWDAAKERHAIGMVNTHSYVNFIADQMAMIGKSKTNPMVLGEVRLNKLFAIQDECAEAELAWLSVEKPTK
jgi:metallo-beta-lactamase class B